MIKDEVLISSVPLQPILFSVVEYKSVNFHLQRKYFFQNLRFPSKLFLLFRFKLDHLPTLQLCLQDLDGFQRLFQISQLLQGVNWDRGILNLGFTETKRELLL